jgi:sugar (pentulose or hexulose) kinase
MWNVQLAVGVDLGTTNTKVSLVEVGERTVTVRRTVGGPTPAPAALAGTLSTLLRELLADQPRPAAVGIASMAETGVPLAADDTPLGNWLRWDGHRAGAEAEALARRLGRAELVRATGTRPGAKVPLATWAWLRGAQPERFAAMARWSGVADLAGLLLTGRLATDHTLAGRTMAYRLPEGGVLPAAFDPALLAEVGLRPDQLPDVAGPAVVGGVRPGPFAEAGLAAGTPVTIAGHDHAVGAFAAGIRRPGQVADSVGTAEAVLTLVATPPDPVAVARAGMSSVVAPDGRSRAVLAGSPAAGGVVEWWLAHEAAGTPAAELFARAATAAVAPGEVLVLPYLHGRQAPVPDPAARLEVLGRRPEHDDAQLARALLEGLCLQARWIMDEQAALAAAEPAGPITVLGGPIAANPAWLEVKAAVSGRPLCLVTEAEAVAAGAAVLAAARAGAVADPPVLPSRAVPVPDPRPDYDPALAAFVAAAKERRS